MVFAVVRCVEELLAIRVGTLVVLAPAESHIRVEQSGPVVAPILAWGVLQAG